jgi:hypothetical protein
VTRVASRFGVADGVLEGDSESGAGAAEAAGVGGVSACETGDVLPLDGAVVVDSGAAEPSEATTGPACPSVRVPMNAAAATTTPASAIAA